MKEQKLASMEKSIKELNAILVQQTAELALKNRELEVEGALEKVRARAMKMQKSDELAETAFVLFQQFKELGEAPDQITIGIVREDVGLIEFWITIDDKQVDQKIEGSVKESNVMNKMFTAWKENKRSLVIDLTGKPLHDYISYRTKLSGTIEKQMTRDFSDNRRVIHCAFFSKGLISFSSTDPKPIETVRLLERFSGVFDQTYTRFLDLQKAEAQAREAQIESALERVRASSLAMHHSDDLHNVIKVVSDQFLWLGLYFETTQFIIVNPDRSWDAWLFVPRQPYPVRINIPYTDHKLFHITEDAVQNQTDFFTVEFAKDEKDSFFTHFFQNTVARNTPEERKQFVLNSKRFTSSWAYQKKISLFLSVLNYEVTPYTDQENSIIKRFGNVFEQAYIRFLDLQKAEAQAREAQIETALERVRSSSLAMHHSDDLHHVITVVSDQFLWLGLNFEATQFAIVNEDRSWDMWTSVPHQPYPARINIPYTDHKLFRIVEDAIQNQIDFLAVALTKDEKDSLYTHFFQNTVARNTPEERKQYIFNSKCLTSSTAYLKKISLGLSIHNFEGIPYTDQENNIIKRFGNVFEQAYIRFLDLQKAEAQAREAQIESALERVRASSLAMHHSDDLHNVIHVVSDQFLWLGLNFESTQFTIVNSDRSWDMWLSVPQQPYPIRINVPYTDHKMFNILEDAIQNQIDFLAVALTKDEKDSLYTHFFQNTVARNTPEERKQYIFNSKCLTGSTAYLKKISLGLSIHNFEGIPYTDQENNIIKRFGNVFEQAYVRFLDLQKAEAQAREAQIEAALERVRGKAMGMHSSEDLAATIRAFYHELVGLSAVPIIRCGAGLPNKEN